MCQDFAEKVVVSSRPPTHLTELKDHPISGTHGLLFNMVKAAFPSGSCLFDCDLKKPRAVLTWGPRIADHTNPNFGGFLTHQRSCY
jgi:hypothetical protein